MRKNEWGWSHGVQVIIIILQCCLTKFSLFRRVYRCWHNINSSREGRDESILSQHVYGITNILTLCNRKTTSLNFRGCNRRMKMSARQLPRPTQVHRKRGTKIGNVYYYHDDGCVAVTGYTFVMYCAAWHGCRVMPM